MEPVAGVAPDGCVQITGVAAREFQPQWWEAGTLNLTCDVRAPLLEPLEGPFRNTHAPSAVRTEDGWLIYYGALDGVESGLALLQRLEYHVSERELIGLRARGPSSCR